MTFLNVMTPPFASNRQPLDADLENLFSLLIETNQIGYEDISTLYDLLDIAKSSDRGLAVLLLGLFASLKEGGICLPLDPAILHPFLNRILLPPGVQLQSLIPKVEESVQKMMAGHFTHLIAQKRDGQKPLVLRKNSSEFALYFQKFDYHENRLRQKMTRLIQDPHGVRVFTPNELKTAYENIFIHSPGALGGEIVRYSDEQKAAVGLAAQNPLTLISGGPGTGKTSVVFALLRCFLQLGMSPGKICLAAPTGRAARRLTESLGESLESIEKPLAADCLLKEIHAQTLHRLLRYSPRTNQFQYNQLNPLPAEVLVVDEVSMVDVVMMSSLLDAVAESCRVILLGDRHQLPSVEAGAVLADILPETAEPTFSKEMSQTLKGMMAIEMNGTDNSRSSTPLQDRFALLTKNFRSNQDILSLARWINHAEIPEIKNALAARKVPLNKEATLWPVHKVQQKSGDDFRWLWLEAPAGNSSEKYFRWLLQKWAEDFYLQAETNHPESFSALVNSPYSQPLNKEEKEKLESLCNLVDRARILTILRRGDRGAEKINELICRYLRKKLEPGLEDGFFNGCPLLVTRNNARMGIYNGDVGVCLQNDTGDRWVAFRLGEEMQLFPLQAVHGPEPGFATTVHKSQGSEFEQVLLVLPRQTTHQLLTREILYTGVTRAKTGLTFLGDQRALVHAVQTRISRFSSPALFSDTDGGQNQENSE